MYDVKPITDSYWVEPGRLLAGEHPGHWDEGLMRRRLAGLLDAGVRLFIDLSASGDAVYPYRNALEKLCRDRGMDAEHLRLPLRAGEVPAYAADIVHILRAIQTGLDSGERVYVHCADGVGRTGMIIGCWLVERGFDPDDALDELARRFATMGKARDYRSTPASALQAEWVENWVPLLNLREGKSEAC